MSAEWHFQLAASQYVHDGAGVIEFAGITLALWLATRRTRGDSASQGERLTATGYRILGWAALAAYPVLGVSYLFNIFGGIIEGVFFIGFTTMALLQLSGRLHRHQGQELSSDHKSGMIGRNSVRMSPSQAG